MTSPAIRHNPTVIHTSLNSGTLLGMVPEGRLQGTHTHLEEQYDIEQAYLMPRLSLPLHLQRAASERQISRLNYQFCLSKDYRDASDGLRKHPHKDVGRTFLILPISPLMPRLPLTAEHPGSPSEVVLDED